MKLSGNRVHQIKDFSVFQKFDVDEKYYEVGIKEFILAGNFINSFGIFEWYGNVKCFCNATVSEIPMVPFVNNQQCIL